MSRSRHGIRRICTALLVPILAGCTNASPSAVPTTQPTSQPTTQASLVPSPTPGEAAERMLRALGDGDESAYRRAVVFRAPSEYVEAVSRAQLASSRLHRAVRDHHIVGKHTQSAGFDRGQTLLAVAVPSGEELERTLEVLRKTEWRIDGDTATIGSENNPSSPRAVRIDGGWIMLSTDANLPAEPDALRQQSAGESRTAAIFDDATARVNSGEFTTIRQINDFISTRRDAQRKAAPAPTPQDGR